LSLRSNKTFARYVEISLNWITIINNAKNAANAYISTNREKENAAKIPQYKRLSMNVDFILN
jgi:predicted membrane chloride channel (bestrophin family)